MRRLLVTATFCLSICVAVMAAEKRWLITPSEAARVAGSPPDSDTLPVAAAEGRGPQIVVMNPRALERLRSPVNILIRFEPGASGQPPDMKSLSVTLRGLISIDITDRLKEYLIGASLEVHDAELPTGNHRIRLTLTDMGGNLSARDVTLIVAAPE